MMRVVLVNMPFAGLSRPSLALTQLRSVLQSAFGDRLSVEIRYLNHELARLMGLELYGDIAESVETQSSGLGEWFFRSMAFPDRPDNPDEYFGRYFPQRDRHSEERRRRILDGRRTVEAAMPGLVERHALDDAHLVGLTSVFFQTTANLALARIIKARNPEVVVVMGGASCEWPMGEALARSAENLDYVVSGPGLRSFPRLVGRLLGGGDGQREPSPGVFPVPLGGTVEAGLRRGPDLDIDTPVALDFEDFLDTVETTFPDAADGPRLLFETSRGCWWGECSQCTFCGLNGLTMQHRAMSPDRAVELIRGLFRYRPRCRYFEAVDNLMPKEYLEDVLPRLRTPEDTTVFYEVKASLTRAEVKALADSGVRRLQPGIESLATSTLRLMRKGTTAFANLAFLISCAEFDVEPAWNLLVGFPGEGEEVYEKYLRDLPHLHHLPPPIGVFPVRFDRYSPYFVEPERWGLDLQPLDFYSLVFPWPEEALADLAYYFMDHRFDAEYQVVMVRWLDRLRAAVRRWQDLWTDGVGGPAPQLRFSADRPQEVVDGRAGGPVVHDVGEQGRTALSRLGRPRPAANVARELEEGGGTDGGAVLGRLEELGLVFREGDRLLSLVQPARAERAPRGRGGSPQRTEGGGSVVRRLSRDAYRVTRSRVTGDWGGGGGGDP